MSRLKIEIYGSEAEVTAFEPDECESVSFLLSSPCDGFISIDGVTARLRGGECIFDLRLLGSGKYTPVLILEDRIVTLPTVIKTGKKFALADCTQEFIRAISKRERELEARVAELEATVKKLADSIFKNTIF